MFWAGRAHGAASFELEIDGMEDKHHITADRVLYHSREKVYEAFGHVVVSSKGKRMSSDYLWIDDQTKEVKARGNVVFVDQETTIQAAELHYNLNTGFGSIFYGKVFNDQYTLKGQLIRKVSEDRFLTTEGEYTTCKDCAESWKLAARNVDMTVDGYAFMDSVFIKIKDIPTLYLPYLIVPVKTRRQSGLLFPRTGASEANGFVYVQPLYLALDDHQDMTLSYGKYTSRGSRYEFEYRFESYGGINGQLNYYRTDDRKYTFSKHRTAFKSSFNLPLFKHLEMKWRIYEIFDRDYLVDFGEMPGYGYPTMESNAVASAPFQDFFLSAQANRYRNLLFEQPTGDDRRTVQTVPTVHFGVRERKLVGPLLGSLYGRYDVFRRRMKSFDDINSNNLFDVGHDTIRETNRTLVQPALSAPFSLGRFLGVAPSVQYTELNYDFAVPTANNPVPSANTRYVQAKVEASAVLARVFDYNGKEINRIKHQFSPFVSFSNIPWIDKGKTGHPFNGDGGQLTKDYGLFDQYDIVPLTNDTNFLRYPQGKSIYYGFNSRLIRKFRGADEQLPQAYPYDLVKKKTKEYDKPLNRKQEIQIERNKLWDKFGPRYAEYQEVWTVNVSQAYDFKSAERLDDKKRAFSYLSAKSDLSLDQLSHTMEYRFFPRIINRNLNSAGAVISETKFSNKHYISTSFTWSFQSLTNLRKTRSFVRSISGGFTNASNPNASRTLSSGLNWSFNDLVSMQLGYRYDLLSKNQLNWSAKTTLTHHSECWGLQLMYDWKRATSESQKSNANFAFQLLFNPMGLGFSGANQTGEGGPGQVFGGI